MAEFKYVMFEVDQGEGLIRDVPIIFPDCVVHAELAKFAARSIMRSMGTADVKPIAAGFCRIYHDGNWRCWGKSESMGDLKSREHTDSRIIDLYEYSGGLRI